MRKTWQKISALLIIIIMVSATLLPSVSASSEPIQKTYCSAGLYDGYTDTVQCLYPVKELATAKGSSEDRSATDFRIIEGAPQNNSRYAVIVKDGDNYYAVMNDGSLAKADYSDGTVSLEYPLVWTYYPEVDQDDDSSEILHNLRIEIDAATYDVFHRPLTYYYRYIDPNAESGITTEPDDGEACSGNAVLVYADHTIRGDGNDNYLGADIESMTIIGGVSSSEAAEVYFATIMSVPLFDNRVNTGTTEEAAAAIRENVNSEIVSHIDIGIQGTGYLDVPLAYGNYYSSPNPSEDNLVLTVSQENPVTLHLQKKVDVSQKDMYGAEIKAYDNDGKPLDNAFYVEGYSTNEMTEYSLVQVRVQGAFLVDTVGPYSGTYDSSNDDDDYISTRKDNQVTYKVTIKKEETFDLVYTDDEGHTIQLYDMKGQKLTLKPTISISADFSYWDPKNECPPLQMTFEENYGLPEYGKNYRLWEEGQIIGEWDTGMDFVLGDKDDNPDPNILAIEVVKQVVDEDGNLIYPNEEIAYPLTVYCNTDGDPESVAGGLFVNPFATKEQIAADPDGIYTGYDELTSDEVVVGSGGMGIYYNYKVGNGMYYIVEDSAPLENHVITDTAGKEWAYVETRIETEYIWRNDAYTDKNHGAEGYTSVPEVLGKYYYSDAEGTEVWSDENGQLNNKFLEFYIYNVYTDRGNLDVTKTVSGYTPSSGDEPYQFTVKKGNKYVSAELNDEETAWVYKEESTSPVQYTVNAGETVHFTGLPAGEYVVEEAADSAARVDYDVTITYTVGGADSSEGNVSVAPGFTDAAAITINNNYTHNVTEIITEKAWTNADGSAGPPAGATVTFTLFSDGTETAYTVTLNGTPQSDVPETAGGYEIEAWKAAFIHLPKYRIENGTAVEIEYTVKETTDYPGYKPDTETAANGGTITNVQEEIDIRAYKKWQNADGTKIPPKGAAVTFTLLADGEATDYSVILDGSADDEGKPEVIGGYESEEWTAAFVHLPRYKAGENGTAVEIEYTVMETVTYPGYYIEGKDTVPDGGTITNRQKTDTPDTGFFGRKALLMVLLMVSLEALVLLVLKKLSAGNVRR